MKLTQEMIETARVAKSAGELLLFAKEHGIDMTAKEAATYFQQLNSKGGELFNVDLSKCLFFQGGYYRKVINLMSGWKNNTPMFV